MKRWAMLIFTISWFAIPTPAQDKAKAVPPPDELPRRAESNQRHRVALTTEQIAALRSRSVVVIKTRNRAGAPVAQGSGVIITRGGFVATNYHVMEGACSASVEIEENAKSVPVTDIAVADKSRDLVVFVMGRIAPDVVHLGSSEHLQPGARVVVIGNPEGLARTVSDGLIAGKRVIDGADWIQITAPISHGSSGGAVFDKYGDLVGITTASLENGQNINFAALCRNL